MRTLLLLLRKEFILFRKNKFIPKVTFLFPCMVTLVIPWVATLDVRHVKVCMLSGENNALTRDILTRLKASDFFSVSTAQDYETALERVRRGDCDVILKIPRDFQKSIDEGHPRPPQISANGVDGIKGRLALATCRNR